MVVSCPERVSPPQSGLRRRSVRRDDRLWTSRRLRRPLDDLRFSNSMTVEHNVLGPGSIGHLLRHCTYSTSTHARTDHWYHFDQVGSVVCESSSSAIPSMYQRYADAWGNEMSGYTTGEWTSTWASRDGWGHNTKEYDGDAGLVYMYQRWYQPELGGFMSQDPMFNQGCLFGSGTPNKALEVNQSLPGSVLMYGFGHQNTISYVDPDGEAALGILIGGTIAAILGGAMANVGINSNNWTKCKLGCANNTMGTAGAGTVPLYTPKAGSPPMCWGVLCRALQERGKGEFGLYNSYLEYWNTYCAGPGATIGYYNPFWGSPPFGVNR